MANNEEETRFKLSIETKEFIEGLVKAKQGVEQIGDSKNLDGLVKGLATAGIALGAVGLAVYAVKSALDVTFDAEAIRQVNAQFENLATNSGLVANNLKEGLVEASHGLIDDTELLKSANKAMLELGDRASRLPETMELATKATQVFGGTTQENFEKINMAIANGNVKMLAQLGLRVDQKKALQDYAKEQGIAVDAISRAGQQEALLNAVLKEGGDRYKGVSGDIKEATNTWTQLKVTIANIAEALTLAFDRTIGPTVRNALKDINEFAKGFKTTIDANFGEGVDKAKAQIQTIGAEITKVHIKIQELKHNGAGTFDAMINGSTEQQLKQLENTLVGLQGKIKANQQIIDDTEKKNSELKGQASQQEQDSREDLVKSAENRRKLEIEFLALRQQRLDTDIQLMQDEEKAESNSDEQIYLIKREAELKIADIRTQIAQGRIVDEERANEMILEIESNKYNKLVLQERKLKDLRLDALQNNLNQSKDTAEGISNAFELGSKKAQKDMDDFGKVGQRNFDSFKKHSKDALLEFGAGTKSAADAAKGFILGMLADEAEARGEVMLLASIFPPNPLGIIGGGALIALAGALRAAGGGGSGSSTSAAPSGVGGGSATSFGTRTDESPTVAERRIPKAVSVTVQGNYFETEQTKTALVDLIRQNQDATDFTVANVGGGI